MSLPNKTDVKCLDPKIPDLPPGQLEKLHRYKEELLNAYNDVIVGEDAVDPNVVLPLTVLHAADWNKVNFRESDPRAVAVAQTLFDDAQTNADLHIKYKQEKKRS